MTSLLQLLLISCVFRLFLLSLCVCVNQVLELKGIPLTTQLQGLHVSFSELGRSPAYVLATLVDPGLPENRVLVCLCSPLIYRS